MRHSAIEQMPSRTPSGKLTQAIWNCDLPEFQKLIAAGVDVNKPAGRWEVYAFRTPLGAAVSHASTVIDEDAIASSLSRREGRKPIEGYYNAALHCAAERGHLEVAKALVAAGANPVRPDHTGATPAEVAITNDRHELFELLKPLTYPCPAG